MKLWQGGPGVANHSEGLGKGGRGGGAWHKDDVSTLKDWSKGGLEPLDLAR